MGDMNTHRVWHRAKLSTKAGYSGGPMTTKGSVIHASSHWPPHAFHAGETEVSEDIVQKSPALDLLGLHSPGSEFHLFPC